MTTNEIETAIYKSLSEKTKYSLDNYYRNISLGNVIAVYHDKFPLDTEIGRFEIVELNVGYKDSGISDTSIVLKLTGGVSYYKLTGTYDDSWDVHDWSNEIEAVVPRTVTIIEYS